MPKPLMSRRAKVVTSILLGIGLLAGVGGVARAAMTLVPGFLEFGDGPVHTPPFTQTVHLESGTYVVAERAGSVQQLGPLSSSHGDGTTLLPTDVTVTSSSGVAVRVGDLGATSETYNRGSSVFAGVAKFDIATSGDYAVKVSASGGPVLIAPELGQLFLSAAPWIGVALLGGVLLVAALICFIVGIARQSSRRPVALPPAS